MEGILLDEEMASVNRVLAIYRGGPDDPGCNLFHSYITVKQLEGYATKLRKLLSQRETYLDDVE